MDMVKASVTQVSPLLVTIEGASQPCPGTLVLGTPVAGATCYLSFLNGYNQPPLVFVPSSGGGGGGSMTKAQIDALGVDAGTLDGIDSTAFAARSALDTVNAIRQAQISLSFQNLAGSGADAVWDGTNFKFGTWLAMATAGTHFGSQGEFEGPMPAVGTVIPGYGGAASSTVVSAGIPIPNWNALWAIPNLGAAYTSYSYALTSYSSAYKVPDHWILLAFRNGYDGLLHLGNGRKIDYWRTFTFTNGWSEYSAAYPARYRKLDNGMVVMKGLIKGGGIGAIAQLPVGYRAGDTNQYFVGQTYSGGYVSCYYYTDSAGYLAFAAGSNAQPSLAHIAYYADA